MADIFADDNDEDDRHHELKLSSRDFERELNILENSAFHDAYDESKQKATQQAFDAGYELSFPYFDSVGQLEGVVDVLYQVFIADQQKMDEIRDIQALKSLIGQLYSEMELDFEKQMDEQFQNKSYESANVKPSEKIARLFDELKQKCIVLISETGNSKHNKVIDFVQQITL